MTRRCRSSQPCWDTPQATRPRRTTCGSTSTGCAVARWTLRTSSDTSGRVSVMRETTLEGLVADLVALRHAGGYRFKVQERVLRQFAEHCRREGYPDGSITKEAVDGILIAVESDWQAQILRSWCGASTLEFPHRQCGHGDHDQQGIPRDNRLIEIANSKERYYVREQGRSHRPHK